MSNTSQSQTRLKLVVRNLPPLISVDDVLRALSPFDGQHDFFYFVQGKKSLSGERASLAYIHFKTPEAVLKFHADFNGHAFVDTNGTLPHFILFIISHFASCFILNSGREYGCVVEYAPYQKAPLGMRDDSKNPSTIEDDPDFKAFVAQSTSQENAPKTLGDDLVNNRLDAPKQAVVSPLVEMIRQKELGKLKPKTASQKKGRKRKGASAQSAAAPASPSENKAPKKPKRQRNKKNKSLNITVSSPNANPNPASTPNPNPTSTPSTPPTSSTPNANRGRSPNPNRGRGGGNRPRGGKQGGQGQSNAASPSYIIARIAQSPVIGTIKIQARPSSSAPSEGQS